ncbi:MAG: hypothetical protein KDD69_03995 [Bdellovibrionales bacterium]|nr:hypothetical protein [Bdellovibrionales bacterium]
MWLRLYSVIVTVTCLGLLVFRPPAQRRISERECSRPAASPTALSSGPETTTERTAEALPSSSAHSTFSGLHPAQQTSPHDSAGEQLLALIEETAERRVKDIESVVTLTDEQRSKALNYFRREEQINLMPDSMGPAERDRQYEALGELSDVLGEEIVAKLEKAQEDESFNGELLYIEEQLAYYKEVLALDNKQTAILRSALNEPWEENVQNLQRAYLSEHLGLNAEQRAILAVALADGVRKSEAGPSSATESAEQQSFGDIIDQEVRSRLEPSLTPEQLQKLITYQQMRND